SIAGVMGGKDTAVDKNTQNVYVELAFFDADSIAYAGRNTGIQSDARYRFERELDKGFAKEGMDYATNMILDICGGEASEIFVAGNIDVESKVINYSTESCKTLGGIDISKERQKEILENLEFGVKENGNQFEITVPTWRNDIGDAGDADFVEEVLRIYGYANIPSIPLPREEGVTSAKVSDKKQKEITARRVLASLGLSEAVTFTFVSDKLANLFGGVKDSDKIVNPLSSEHGVLRPNNLVNLLSSVAANSARGSSNLRMFEIGSVFRKENEEQTNEIAGLISGLTHNKHWLEDNREVDVFDIKETLLELMKNIGAPTGQLRNGALEYYHPGRSGTLALGKFPIAYFGEIHPKVLEAFGIKQRVVAFELLLDNIPASKKKKGTAKSKLDMSNLQATFRDFAFILDRDIPAEELIQSVKKADKLIEDVEIFDVYEGDNLGDNKKSLAIKVKIQPKEKTLTDKDLDLISSAIVLNVTKQTQGQLRK
ncbi:MAG: phenylalanine--tRNA ligase subunit beta, partial [Alphaproteobacteria bacterium]|nr:phenylalanine--tRNA ligase subunit beta [Alphaproteobacteria bacterium]